MVPLRSATPSDWLRGQWGGVLKVRLRWQEVVLVASALRKAQLEGRKKKMGWGQETKSGFQRCWGQKLTFDELDHFLVGHGGHERAVHLEKERSSYVSGAEKQKDAPQSRAWGEQVTFMILSPSWTPALTAAPPGRTFWTSLTLSPQTVKPKPSWSFCTTTHL